MLETAFQVAALYIGLNALLLLVLALNVGTRRSRQNALQPGATGDETLVRAVRAHGNFTEYMPVVLVILLILALLKAPTLLLHFIGLVFTLGRVAHALGMMQPRHPNALRFAGNLSTGIVLLIGGIACLYYSFL